MPAEVWHASIRMRCFSTDPEQCAECTHDLAFPGDIGDPLAVAAALNEAWAFVMVELGDNVQAEGVTLKRMEPSVGHTLRVKFDPPTAGSMTGSVQPTAVAVKAVRRTGLPGKQNHGLLYIPWTTESQEDADHVNQLSAAAITGMNNALEAFRACLGGANAAGVVCYPVVYSYRSATGGHHWAYITRYDTLPHYGALAKRGRRNRVCPPFDEEPTGDRIATISSGLFHGSAGTLVNDHRQWHAVRSIAACYATSNTDPADYSVAGFDDSGWHGVNQVSAVFENQLNPCTVTDATWTWPPIIFSAFGDLTFPLAECFGPGRQTGTCDVGFGHTNMTTGEQVEFRREWHQSADPIAVVMAKVNADDSYELWLNGTLVGGRSFDEAPAFSYIGPDVYDVTDLITVDAMNCVGLRVWFAGPGQNGTRMGPCDYPGHRPVWTDFRHGWGALEIRTWNALVE